MWWLAWCIAVDADARARRAERCCCPPAPRPPVYGPAPRWRIRDTIASLVGICLFVYAVMCGAQPVTFVAAAAALFMPFARAF